MISDLYKISELIYRIFATLDTQDTLIQISEIKNKYKRGLLLRKMTQDHFVLVDKNSFGHAIVCKT